MTAKHRNDKFTRSVITFGVSRCFGALLLGFTGSFGALSASHAAVPLTLEQTKQTIAASAHSGSAGAVPGEKDLRAKAMREAAQSYGARAGLLRRTHEIREGLDHAAAKLDVIYNFGPLMLVDQPGDDALHARDIVPPVIVSEDSHFQQDSNTIIHKGGPNYHIFSQAKFVPVPPTWRDYLYPSLGEQVPAAPHPSLLPKTPDEQEQFAQWVEQGWNAGVAQANDIYTNSLNRLDRDFIGMAKYYDLVEQGMLSMPFVATSNLGVSGDATHLNLNDATLRITVMPQFRLDSSKWTVIAR